MNRDPTIHAYWRGREETHRECVARTLQFLKITSEDPQIKQWFITANTRKAAGTPQQLTMEAIGKRMKPVWKRCRGIPDPQLTDEIGFSFSAWNGNDDAAVGLHVSFG